MAEWEAEHGPFSERELAEGLAGRESFWAAPLARGLHSGRGYLRHGGAHSGDRNDRRMWALHIGFIAEEVAPTVPAPRGRRGMERWVSSGQPGSHADGLRGRGDDP